MPLFHRDLLIRRGHLVDPANRIDAIADVLIEGGRVSRTGPDLEAPAGIPVLDAGGLVVAPGFIDGHVHLREPGFEHKETIATGTAAAAAGGICAVVAMPNTTPPPDSDERLAAFHEKARTAQVRVYPCGCITRDRAGRELAPLVALARSGAVAFSDDGEPVEDEELMRQALLLARQVDRPVFPHAEVKRLTAGGCMHQGAVSARLGVRGMPAQAEDEMIARDLELVRQTGGPLHLAHLSTAGAVALVRQAKAEGLPVTCEATPHHFTLTDEEVARQGPAAKMSPPLRPAADVRALAAGLGDGTIDAIATDHAPHTEAEKQNPLDQAPFGIVGLETAVGLTLSFLVRPGHLDLAGAIARWSWAPARIFRIPGGHLGPGAPGDVTLIDLDQEWTVDPSRFRSRSRNTPFAGYRLRGRAVATIVGGQVVYSDLGS